MKHTTKMLLIPEDVYKALVSNANARYKAYDKKSFSRDKDLPDLLASTHKERIKEILNRSDLNPDEKQIHYTQLFKRYQKFLADKANRPIKVHVDNLDSVKDKIKNLETSWETFKSHNTPRIEEEENFQNTMREPSVSSHASEEIAESEDADDDARYSDAPGISEAAFSPLKTKLRPYIKDRRRFDPYVISSKTPSLAQRHQLFNRNKRTNAKSNRNRTNAPPLTGNGAFKPSLWF